MKFRFVCSNYRGATPDMQVRLDDDGDWFEVRLVGEKLVEVFPKGHWETHSVSVGGNYFLRGELVESNSPVQNIPQKVWVEDGVAREIVATPRTIACYLAGKVLPKE